MLHAILICVWWISILPVEVVTALQAENGTYMSGLKAWQLQLVRAGGERYNVTSRFEMCMVNFNFACEVVTALQAENGTYMLGLKAWQQQLVRAGGKCYNVTSHFEMCMVNFNFAC